MKNCVLLKLITQAFRNKDAWLVARGSRLAAWVIGLWLVAQGSRLGL